VHVPKVLSGLLLAALLLTGCSSDAEQGASTASPEGGGSGADAAAPAQEAAAGAAAGSEGSSAVADLRIAPGSALIRTADLEVRVDDVQDSAEAAARIARDAGGRVQAEDRSGTGPDRSASVELRVPSDRFDAVLTDLAELGDEQSRQVSSEDVASRWSTCRPGSPPSGPASTGCARCWTRPDPLGRSCRSRAS
jgi:hypothetical protein